MTSEERTLIERAADRAWEAAPMTGKLSVAQWLLRAGVAEATRILTHAEK